jgi:hypothetical protein
VSDNARGFREFVRTDEYTFKFLLLSRFILDGSDPFWGKVKNLSIFLLIRRDKKYNCY